MAVVVVKSAGSRRRQQIEGAVVEDGGIQCGLVDSFTSESGNATIARSLIGGLLLLPHCIKKFLLLHTRRAEMMRVAWNGSVWFPLLTHHDEPPLTLLCVARCPSSREDLSPTVSPDIHTTPGDGNSMPTMTMT